MKEPENQKKIIVKEWSAQGTHSKIGDKSAKVHDVEEGPAGCRQGERRNCLGGIVETGKTSRSLQGPDSPRLGRAFGVSLGRELACLIFHMRAQMTIPRRKISGVGASDI